MHLKIVIRSVEWFIVVMPDDGLHDMCTSVMKGLRTFYLTGCCDELWKGARQES